VFSSVLPAFPEGNMTAPVMVQRLLVLLLALLCTGIGAAMSLNMRILYFSRQNMEGIGERELSL